MKKLFIYGPQGSGKTTLAKLIIESRKMCAIVTVAERLEEDLRTVGFRDATIVVEEVTEENVFEVETYLSGWIQGYDFVGLVIFTSQIDLSMYDGWVKYECTFHLKTQTAPAGEQEQ